MSATDDTKYTHFIFYTVDNKSTSVNLFPPTFTGNYGRRAGTTRQMAVVLHVAKGLAIGGTGVALGFLTFMPNAMMSDSGSQKAMLSANLGMAASLSFLVGGVVGGLSGLPAWLLPGVGLEIAALTVFSH
eukprot:g10535.t1